MSQDTVIVDGEGQILGRLSSEVVRLLKEGKRVDITNAEKIVISGPRERVVAGYMLLFRVGTLFNPYRQGIRRPRSPINLVKRTIRGMLPKTPKGENMLKRVRVYVGVPAALQGKEAIKFQAADVKRLKGKYVTVGELARVMGWRSSVK